MPKTRRVDDIDGLLREAVARGAEITSTSEGHYKIKGPDGTAVVSPKWGGPRDRLNSISDVRRYAGIDVMEPVSKARPPSPTDVPPKLQLNGKRPDLVFEKPPGETELGDEQAAHADATEQERLREQDGPPVTRSDHDALLTMLDELTARLEVWEYAVDRLIARIDVLERSTGPAPKSDPRPSRSAELREQALAYLGSLPVGLQLTRSSIADGIGVSDVDEIGLLSNVLQGLRRDGLVVSSGVRGGTRWKIVP